MSQAKEIKTKKAPEAVGPYSQAILFNNIIFCSGQIGINPDTGNLNSESIKEEILQVFNNLKAVLEKANSSFDQVVKVEVFLTNMDYFAELNDIYSGFFTSDPKPARQTVEVSKLPKGARVEISCIAYI